MSAQRMLNGLVTIPKGAIRARVQDGVVTLTGALAWDFLRATVHNLVAHLRGVVDLVDLTSLTEGTTGVLTGTAGSWVERRDAEGAAWSSPHVTEVRNDIVVAPAATVRA
jgi:osmotically-inducible protein OsmY